MSEFEKFIEAAQGGDIDRIRLILGNQPELTNRRDATGATALHFSAIGGHTEVVRELVRQGAEINARDDQFGGTPAGWAIEYMREMGALLGIEIDDLAYAIRRGDVEWVRRFVRRFPALRTAHDNQGQPLKVLAQQSGSQEILNIFSAEGPDS